MARFRFVNVVEFTEFIRNYPRSLRAKPLVGRRAHFRSWMDETRGAWPDNVVAKAFERGRSGSYEVLDEADIA